MHNNSNTHLHINWMHDKTKFTRVTRHIRTKWTCCEQYQQCEQQQHILWDARTYNINILQIRRFQRSHVLHPFFCLHNYNTNIKTKQISVAKESGSRLFANTTVKFKILCHSKEKWQNNIMGCKNKWKQFHWQNQQLSKTKVKPIVCARTLTSVLTTIPKQTKRNNVLEFQCKRLDDHVQYPNPIHPITRTQEHEYRFAPQAICFAAYSR